MSTRGRPAFLKTKKNSSKVNSKQSSLSASSSNIIKKEPFDPVDHALHIEKHIAESVNQINTIAIASKDCTKQAAVLNNRLEKLIEKHPDSADIETVARQSRQFTLLLQQLIKDIEIVKDQVYQNQKAFELLESSIFEYTLSQARQDIEPGKTGVGLIPST